MKNTMLSKSVSEKGKAIGEAATGIARQAQSAFEDGGAAAMDETSKHLKVVVDYAASLLSKMSDQRQQVVQKGRAALNDASDRVATGAAQASSMARGYTRDEPAKALLIAAATGAMIVGLIWMLTPSHED